MPQQSGFTFTFPPGTRGCIASKAPQHDANAAHRAPIGPCRASRCRRWCYWRGARWAAAAGCHRRWTTASRPVHTVLAIFRVHVHRVNITERLGISQSSVPAAVQTEVPGSAIHMGNPFRPPEHGANKQQHSNLTLPSVRALAFMQAYV